jgi:hypothetical protein
MGERAESKGGGRTLLRAPDEALDGVAFIVDYEDDGGDVGFDHGSYFLDG